MAILAGKFHELSTVAFIVCFALLQFFFNFGANATTYVRVSALFFLQLPFSTTKPLSHCTILHSPISISVIEMN